MEQNSLSSLIRPSGCGFTVWLPAQRPSAPAEPTPPAATIEQALSEFAELEKLEVPAASKEPVGRMIKVAATEPAVAQFPMLTTLAEQIKPEPTAPVAPVAVPVAEESEMPAITIGNLPAVSSEALAALPVAAPVFVETSAPAVVEKKQPEVSLPVIETPQTVEPEPLVEQAPAPKAEPAALPVVEAPLVVAKPSFFATKVNRLWKYAAILTAGGWFVANKDGNIREEETKAQAALIAKAEGQILSITEAKNSAETKIAAMEAKVEELVSTTTKVKSESQGQSSQLEQRLAALNQSFMDTNQTSNRALDGAKASLTELSGKLTTLQTANTALAEEMARTKRDAAAAITAAREQVAKLEAEKAAAAKAAAEGEGAK